MQYEDVLYNLKELFKRRYGFDFDKYPEDVVNLHLLGRPFDILPSDLLYLFFDVENDFGIQIPEETVIAGKFDTLSNIALIIHSQL